MFKKIILAVAVLLLVVSSCFAADVQPKTIGVFLDAPSTYVNNETVRKMIPEKAKTLFPSPNYNVLPFDQTQMEMRTYREDNRMIVNQYYSQPLNREDIQKISKGLNCDYALFITVSNAAPRVSSGLFSVTFRTSVTCDVRLLNIETGKYIMSKEIVKDGSSTAVVAGVPSFDKAYNEALEKALDELKVDLTAI